MTPAEAIARLRQAVDAGDWFDASEVRMLLDIAQTADRLAEWLPDLPSRPLSEAEKDDVQAFFAALERLVDTGKEQA